MENYNILEIEQSIQFLSFSIFKFSSVISDYFNFFLKKKKKVSLIK